jgi:triphosphatase
MNKDQEIELKLALLDSSDLDKVTADSFLLSLAVTKWQKAHLVSTYYDTKQQSLMNHRMTFRIRSTDHRIEATVKAGGNSTGGLHERQEWNVPIEAAVADDKIFAATTVGESLRAAVNGSVLLPLFTTNFIRKILLVKYEASLIEVAVDQGQVIVGDLSAPILEMELELKSGTPLDLIRLGAILAERFKLRLEQRSKYQRGLCLAGVAWKEKILRSDEPRYFLWAYLEKEAQFIQHPGNRTASDLLIDFYDKLRLKVMKSAASLHLSTDCLELMDEWGLLFQPLREVDLLGTYYRRLVKTGEITSQYHGVLVKAYFRHRRQLKVQLVTALRQGATTSWVLQLWAGSLERQKK